MKKTLVIILAIVLCIALAGAAVAVGGEGKIFNKEDVLSEPDLQTADTEEKEGEKAGEPTNSSKIEGTVEIEALTAEDKALKAEIAKISDTKVDFRNTKLDTIGNKTYNMKYKKLANTSGKYPRIIYNLELDNGREATFEYSVNSGNLTEALVPTGVYTKTENSITFEQAQKIAITIAQQYCDTSVYKLARANEWMQFYEFTFARFISGYETAEGVYICLDFNGDIFRLTVGTDIFDNRDFTVDAQKMTAALEKHLAETHPNYTGYEIERQRISISNGAPIMEYYVAIKIGDSGTTEIVKIPIE